MKLRCRDYDVTIEYGALPRVGELFDLNRKTLVVTDDGVPKEYAKAVCDAASSPLLITVAAGEKSKSLESFGTLLKAMLEGGFTRGDCVVAVGGGVVGDLAGFAASAYMRGIDFYNVPTTLLSQLDSSVGGKTAINFCGVKNIVGAFYQPKAVLIDPDVLKTLDRRQFSSGLAEAVKMSVTSDAALFEKLKGDFDVSEIIADALKIKISVVEQDEKEAGLRRILNFGHTIGHGIEAQDGFYHGECVALGMLCASGEKLRGELIPIFEKYGLPTKADFDDDAVMSAIMHDKKSAAGGVNMIFSDGAGSYCEKKMNEDGIRALLPVIKRG